MTCGAHVAGCIEWCAVGVAGSAARVWGGAGCAVCGLVKGVERTGWLTCCDKVTDFVSRVAGVGSMLTYGRRYVSTAHTP